MSGKADVIAAIASMSAEERAAVAAALGASGSADRKTPKLSTTLDAVPDADVGKVVAACRAGVKVAAEDPGAGDDKVGAPLLSAAPAVFAAAQTNSIHRRKPLVHSLHAIAGYLGRRAPAHVAAAAADAGTKGGGK